MFGPVMSASSRPTAAPARASATARLTLTVLLPTPPLPDATAITFLTPGQDLLGRARRGAADRGAPVDREARDAHRVERAADLGLDLVLERAGRRGELDRERHVGAVDDDVPDHVPGDEVAAELGLLDGSEGIEDGGLGDGAHRVRVRSCAAGRIVDRCTTRGPSYPRPGANGNLASGGREQALPGPRRVSRPASLRIGRRARSRCANLARR